MTEELRWKDLTPAEQAAVKEAFDIARGREAIIYREKQGRHNESVVDELERFAKQIDELSPLAQKILGEIREGAITGELPPTNAMEQIRHQIFCFTEGIERTPGRRTQHARIEAAEMLRDIWIERGFEPVLGAVRREKKSPNYSQSAYLASNPMLAFVADCFLAIDPELNALEFATSAAHSALRPSK